MDIARRDFFDVIGSRRSVRYFKPWKPVEPEKVEAVLQAARIASIWNAMLCRLITDCP